MHISEADYDTPTIRRKAASWMRMSNEDHIKWTEQEQHFREYLRNSRARDNITGTENNRDNIEIITIK